MTTYTGNKNLIEPSAGSYNNTWASPEQFERTDVVMAVAERVDDVVESASQAFDEREGAQWV